MLNLSKKYKIFLMSTFHIMTDGTIKKTTGKSNAEKRMNQPLMTVRRKTENAVHLICVYIKKQHRINEGGENEIEPLNQNESRRLLCLVRKHIK